MQADARTQAHACTRPRMPKHSHTRPHMPTHAHTRHSRPHTPTHTHTRLHTPKNCSKFFLQLYMALLTIFCGGFLDNFLQLCWQSFAAAFLDDFVDNFLQLYLFCFICSTKYVHAVQKSVARFERGGWEPFY